MCLAASKLLNCHKVALSWQPVQKNGWTMANANPLVKNAVPLKLPNLAYRYSI